MYSWSSKRLSNAVYKQNTIEKWMKDWILPFPKKDDLGITKNYSGKTLTAIAVKVYNTLILSCIWPEIEKTLSKKSECLSEESLNNIISKWKYLQ